MIRKMEEEVKTKVDEKMKDELMMANATMEKMAHDMAKVCVRKVGVTMVVVGILGWICGKLMSQFRCFKHLYVILVDVMLLQFDYVLFMFGFRNSLSLLINKTIKATSKPKP